MPFKADIGDFIGIANIFRTLETFKNAELYVRTTNFL